MGHYSDIEDEIEAEDRRKREPYLTMADRVIQSRAGGRVERLHAIPHIERYQNSSHQWGVSMLMLYLYPRDFPRLVAYALTHDVPEAWFGDIPAPTLRYVPGIREGLADLEGGLNRSLGLPGEDELDADDLLKLKVCDRFELYLFCMEEQARGNRFVDEVITELNRFFRETPLPEEAVGLLAEINKRGALPRMSGVVKELTR